MITSVFQALERTRPYLSFRPFDGATAESLRECWLRAAVSPLIALLAQSVAIAAQLISLSLILNYLGAEHFSICAGNVLRNRHARVCWPQMGKSFLL